MSTACSQAKAMQPLAVRWITWSTATRSQAMPPWPFPLEYGVTGIMSFMVSENGIILEKDLGEDGLQISLDMESFDPGEGWVPF